VDYFFEIHLFERGQEHELEGQRERGRESEADSTLSMELDMGLDLVTLKSQT